MTKDEINAVNESLAKTQKLIISLGCSFVEGQGAIDQEIYDNYKWTIDRVGVPMQPDISLTEKRRLVKKHDTIELVNDELRFHKMEKANSFVNVLCKKYFNGSYTPLNLGKRGRGNRASIRSLYYLPEINWHHAKEIIVIYVPSSIERFDFVADHSSNSDVDFICMWPHWKDQPKGARQTLWRGYNDALYTDKFAVLEQIGNFVELQNWCDLKNAKLVITPGFDRSYSRSTFLKNIQNKVERNHTMALEREYKITEQPNLESLERIVNTVRWGSFFKPNNSPTFVDLVMKQELRPKTNYWDYIGEGSPKKWITACCHPSAKAHDFFALKLYEHIDNE
jgi:hypothetical protein